MKNTADTVKQVIANALGIDAEDIDEDASLIDSYGMESLDFLDISFQLNKLFKIRLFRGDFLRKATEHFGESLIFIDENGMLTQAGVALLQARMPEVTENPLLVAGVSRNILGRLYCARSWIRGVNELLDYPDMTGEQFTEEWLKQYKEQVLSHK